MENMTYKTKMVAVVTLYQPDIRQAADNIKRYIEHIDRLIVWDNSPSACQVQERISNDLAGYQDKIEWNATGENRYIAAAINYAWQFAKEQGYELLLIMDQDSRWENFYVFRQETDKQYSDGKICVYTPFIVGYDEWEIKHPVEERSVFINSGTVIPISILDAVKGADETFALDALDVDLSYRIRKASYQIRCYTNCLLYHIVGNPIRKGPFNLMTPNYGRERTYSITKGYILCYRRHRDIMTADERRRFFKEILMWKLIRIVLAEDDKIGRFRMFVKGIKDGVTAQL